MKFKDVMLYSTFYKHCKTLKKRKKNPTASHHPYRKGLTRRADRTRHSVMNAKWANYLISGCVTAVVPPLLKCEQTKREISFIMFLAARRSHRCKLPRRKWPVRVDCGTLFECFLAVSYSFVWTEQIAGNGIQIESSCLLRSLNPPSP